jgi:hypothetical protein
MEMKQSRGDIYSLPIDKNALQMESQRNYAAKMEERKRAMTKKQRDEYYNNMNQGLLNH